MPKTHGRAEPARLAPARDLPAEWASLRAWLAPHLSKLNLTGLGKAAGLTPQQAKALLAPPADATRITRTAATAARLDAVVAVLRAAPFGYEPA